MLISKNFRGLGIGTMLLKALLSWAEGNPYIEKVSLGVFSTNHRAISLYQKMGFKEEGRKINEFKFNDSEYVDDILMYKLVKWFGFYNNDRTNPTKRLFGHFAFFWNFFKLLYYFLLFF